MAGRNVIDRYATGYVDGLRVAIGICRDEAEVSDRRTEDERRAGMKPRETTRRLRQVISRIRDRVNDKEMPRAGV